jgi:hypothetical protein
MRWSDATVRRDDRFQCALCGADIDVAEAEVPEVLVVGAAGVHKNRVVVLHGEVIHLCEIRVDAEVLRVP